MLSEIGVVHQMPSPPKTLVISTSTSSITAMALPMVMETAFPACSMDAKYPANTTVNPAGTKEMQKIRKACTV